MFDALTMLERFLAARSDYRRSLPDLIEAWRKRVPSIMHPYGQEVVHDHLCQMRRAVDSPAEFARLAAMLRERVVGELCWEALKAKTAGNHKLAYRLRRQAERFERLHVQT